MHMVVTTIISAAIMVFAITTVGFFIGKINKFGDSDEIIDISSEKGEQIMSMTQIWMLCIVIAMVFFVALQGVWSLQKKDDNEE